MTTLAIAIDRRRNIQVISLLLTSKVTLRSAPEALGFHARRNYRNRAVAATIWGFWRDEFGRRNVHEGHLSSAHEQHPAAHSSDASRSRSCGGCRSAEDAGCS